MIAILQQDGQYGGKLGRAERNFPAVAFRLFATYRSVGEVDLDRDFSAASPDNNFGHVGGVRKADFVYQVAFVEHFRPVEFEDDVVVSKVRLCCGGIRVDFEDPRSTDSIELKLHGGFVVEFRVQLHA